MQKPDIQKMLAQHLHATRERDRWAYKAKELFDAGNAAGARSALAKADNWAATMTAIEQAAKPEKP